MGFPALNLKRTPVGDIIVDPLRGWGEEDGGGYVAPKNEGTTQFNDFKMRAVFF